MIETDISAERYVAESILFLLIPMDSLDNLLTSLELFHYVILFILLIRY